MDRKPEDTAGEREATGEKVSSAINSPASELMKDRGDVARTERRSGFVRSCILRSMLIGIYRALV